MASGKSLTWRDLTLKKALNKSRNAKNIYEEASLD